MGSVFFGSFYLNKNMDKRSIIKKVLLAFEQSSTSIKYDAIYKYNDGPNKIKQITVSFGITEYGNLKKLLTSYVEKGGRFKSSFESYLPSVGVKPLVSDDKFVGLLKESASDPLMQMCQESAYESMYIEPAYKFCSSNGFETNLSKLVICDSYLHSGSILSLLRNKFSESVPAKGGDEKVWTKSYCEARKNWLTNHSNKKTYQKTIFNHLIICFIMSIGISLIK
jgi:chitosanase